MSTGVLGLISANILGQVISTGSVIFGVKFLAPRELAEAKVIQTYVGYVSVTGAMGLATSVATHIPRSNDQGIKLAWLARAMLLALLGTCTICVLAYVLASLGMLMANVETFRLFRWALFAALASSAGSVMTAWYQAEKQIDKLACMQLGLRIASLLVVICGAWLAGLNGYIVAWISASALSAGVLILGIKWEGLEISGRALPTGFIKAGIFALAATVLWTVGKSADVVIIDKLVANRDLFGAFVLAATLLAFPNMICSSIQSVAIPYFAERLRDPKWLIGTARKLQAGVTAISVGSAAITYVCALGLVHYLYGRAYAATPNLLLPMLVGFIFISTITINSAALLGVGLVRINTLVASVAVPLAVGVSYVMIRHFGVWGAAWAQAVNGGVYAGLQSFLGWRSLRQHAAQL